MGFAIPVGLLFIGILLIATATIQLSMATQNASNLASAQKIWRDKILPNKWTKIQLINSSYNATTSKISYEIKNTGSTAFDFNNADVYRNQKKYPRTNSGSQLVITPNIINKQLVDPGEMLSHNRKATDLIEGTNYFTISTPQGSKQTFSIDI